MNEFDVNDCSVETDAYDGMSDGGKSHLETRIPRFYDVTEGRVMLDGEDIRNYTIESLRNNIGLVMQDNILFSDSILENIMLAKPDATEEEVVEAAKRANAHEFIMG